EFVPKQVKRQNVVNHSARIPSLWIATIEGRQRSVELSEQVTGAGSCELWMSYPIAEKLQPQVSCWVAVVFEHLADLDQDADDSQLSLRFFVQDRPKFFRDGVSGH